MEMSDKVCHKVRGDGSVRTNGMVRRSTKNTATRMVKGLTERSGSRESQEW